MHQRIVMLSCHTVIAAIEASVAMADSGIIDWVNEIHSKSGSECESWNARTIVISRD